MRLSKCLLLAAGLAATLAGCTAPPPLRSILVVTDPPGASCRAIREGRGVGLVSETPGRIRATQALADIILTCEAPGHLPAVALIPSSVQPGMAVAATLGGGVLAGLFIVASGQASDYPAEVQVSLQPDRFVDAAAREQVFTAARTRLAGYFEDALARQRSACGPQEGINPIECGPLLTPIRQQWDAALARLERQRSNGVVAQQ